MAAKGNALWVSVADVRAFAPVPIEQFLGDKVVQDCLGRGWLADADAREVLERAKAEDRREMLLRNQHAMWLQDRTARRAALAQEAEAKVKAENPGRMMDGSFASIITERRRAALREFDAAEPELDYYRWRDKQPTMAAAR